MFMGLKSELLKLHFLNQRGTLHDVCLFLVKDTLVQEDKSNLLGTRAATIRYVWTMKKLFGVYEARGNHNISFFCGTEMEKYQLHETIGSVCLPREHNFDSRIYCMI